MGRSSGITDFPSASRLNALRISSVEGWNRAVFFVIATGGVSYALGTWTSKAGERAQCKHTATVTDCHHSHIASFLPLSLSMAISHTQDPHSRQLHSTAALDVP